ncbi:SGNH/GDSL hydrolase family protein [Alteromonas sp. BL110]|uniref:SGNH/GDSL hydrolase family protein n=1 Tax=Alteromonas sp. BL110 TaxID=1714845 RepID=UPI000E48051F|nr:SGNH/GDSL hydrolase family protein [Alteromonas sp. BL110]AXT40853.1 SGNH/GDSL hydrolase family protein [Alteromonas sp. BL110]RKM81006.1 SGNH/GDSL hydrolase family protein [Alteromonas sp. BL110]
MIYFKVLALNLAIVLLFPVVLMQALWVRKKTAVLPEPEGERVLTSVQGSSLPPTNLLVVGDSAAAGVGALTQESALTGLLYASLSQIGPARVSLHAKTGFKSEDVLSLLRDLPSENFSSALISIGVNDVTKFVSLKRWQQNIDAISALLIDKFGCERIVFTALPPIHCFPALPQPLRALLGWRALLLNQALVKSVTACSNAEILYVTALNVRGTVVDIQQSGLMAEDGFHPSSKGYEMWARLALDRLTPIHQADINGSEKTL